MEYKDRFKPRPAQDDVIEAVLKNVQTGKKETVALLAPGSGKELLGQAVGCHLYRLGLIDYVLILTPRIQLAQQCETNWRSARKGVKRPRRNSLADWTGNFELFDAACRIEFIEHTKNRRPLVEPSIRGVGVASTYQSLVTDRGRMAYEEFAKRHEGRFLVVVDEAQFCGDDDGGGGTRAGEMVKLLHRHAAHMLIMTGTAERSDGAPLVCCTYADEPNSEGKRPLKYDKRATYQDGIREGYLRKFVSVLSDHQVIREDVETEEETVTDLSEDGSNLKQVLRRPDVWTPIADETVEWLKDKRRRNVAYQALISCMEKNDAQRVYAYLKRMYPDLRVAIAVSEQEDAVQVLREFKDGGADILVTVRMAFIGYDCKTITVVGILTNYRDKGHLMQLVGRGLRVSDHESFEEQSCVVVAPDDPQMQKFIEELKEESEQGIRDRESREGGGAAPQASTIVVREAEQIGCRSVSDEGEVDLDEYQSVMSRARQFGLSGDPHALRRFVESYQTPQNDNSELTLFGSEPKTSRTEAPKTAQERIEELCSDTSTIIKQHISRQYSIFPGDPSYQDLLIKLTSEVNRKAKGNSGDAKRDEELAFRRYDWARRLYGVSQAAS